LILVQQHIIKPNNEYFNECLNLTHLSKNLYNQALYRIRQHYFETQSYKNVFELINELVKEKQVDYYALPTKVSKMCLNKLNKNFISFFKANQDYKVNPSKYKAKPRIPNYLDKNGSFVVEYYKEAISKKQFKLGILNPSQTNIHLTFKNLTWNNLVGVRIIPKNNYFIIEVLYEKTELHLKQDNHRYMSIDLGVNNLATITDNINSKPIIINGKPIKSINQYYNKEKARLTSELELKQKVKTSKQLNKLSLKRNNKINDYLHKSSSYIVNQLVSKSINTLIIGRNKDWKQDINIGSKNNQNFVSIPFYKFIQMISYKCKLHGINIILNEESYTSKCSFIDNEKLCKHDVYLGKRVKRGLFKSNSGLTINADVNGSFNILRKVICSENKYLKVVHNFKWIEGLSVNPLKVNLL